MVSPFTDKEKGLKWYLDIHLNCLRVCRINNNCNAGGCVDYKVAVVVRQYRDGNYFDT